MPPLIPTQPWTDVYGFVLGLSRTQGALILYFKFKKWSISSPCKKTTFVVKVALLYSNEVYRLHELPTSIVFDRDTNFSATFGGVYSICWNTQLNFNSVTTIPKQMVRSKLLAIHLGICRVVWLVNESSHGIRKICEVEFAYNHIVKWSLNFSPSHII